MERFAENETLREENEALRAAIRHLLIVCRDHEIDDLAVRLAENALNRNKQIT